ncbi:VRR-NUC domain-containing protein [Phytohalomonas tamaricis]|uniref:VRR-NUC domain-containing protein n=1 Tax=Phytohalomonas tamaricis TaxID=2081032 RepID=UPI000D0AC38E|nr:VRR-NUC domain-containing protein [Phytohalomonas tamaricis]
MINGTLDDPFYYLVNFCNVLRWVRARYSDLLSAPEQDFIECFLSLPQASQALLVRMIMRKGIVFRASKLTYEEIGLAEQAIVPLQQHGWVDLEPTLTLEQLFGLLTKKEITANFKQYLPKATISKREMLEKVREALQEESSEEVRCFKGWCEDADECLYALTIMGMCDRFRLMLFGNLRQDWSEFVLAELGVYRYETVEFSMSSRAFRTRDDIDLYLHIHDCRERFEQGESAVTILEALPGPITTNSWLESRRAKLLYQLAQHHERMNEPATAVTLYKACAYPGARVRRLRVLERSGQYDEAFDVAQDAEATPESEAEKQHVQRILPRLRRKLGLPQLPKQGSIAFERMTLKLPKPAGESVEAAVRDHLSKKEGPVHYVENTLLNALFGLLCWDTIFAAVPGAFFHPFHVGPADLLRADFYHKRAALFEACLSQLDSAAYQTTIWNNFAAKQGIQSPFIYWEAISEALLDQALTCLPAKHLKQWFERMLIDLKANRAGFPDLIQFWPNERRYKMIEVKGPGDRLQDNQLRWLEFCTQHDMPVAVCYVQWATSPYEASEA